MSGQDGCKWIAVIDCNFAVFDDSFICELGLQFEIDGVYELYPHILDDSLMQSVAFDGGIILETLRPPVIDQCYFIDEVCAVLFSFDTNTIDTIRE